MIISLLETEESVQTEASFRFRNAVERSAVVLLDRLYLARSPQSMSLMMLHQDYDLQWVI
jgi:hypothetical protein